MPDETRRSAPVFCPKCKGKDTQRTGAFNVEARPMNSPGDDPEIVVVYDRRCQQCGALFPETTKRDR